MSLKNATVSLSYKIKGTLLTRGVYEYRDRTTTGNLLEEDRRLFITKRPTLSDCHVIVHLNEHFVNNAISDEARPSRDNSFRAFTFWRKMTETERLHWHVAKYVGDFGSSDYTYQTLEA